jgi:hypothetical protein
MKTDLSPEASWRGHPAQIPVSEDGEKTPPIGILEMMEFQTAPAEESWRRWPQDFPPWRESALAWYLSCPPLLEIKEQEKEILSKKEMKRRNVRWFPAGNEWDIYRLESVMPLQ